MPSTLTKRDAERLLAALDDVAGEDESQRTARWRDALATALARLIGGTAPWPDLVDAAAMVASWPQSRVERLKGPTHSAETADALSELITELNETRRL
jgi:hypothetical protein